MLKFCCLIFLTAPLLADVKQNEIETLHELICATKRNLCFQEKLLRDLIEFKKARASFIEDPTSARLATKLVKTATQFYVGLQQERLEHLFATDFLIELAFYTQVGRAQKINYDSLPR